MFSSAAHLAVASHAYIPVVPGCARRHRLSLVGIARALCRVDTNLAHHPGRIALNARAIRMAVTVLTMPGNIKLWFNRYFPILVVPV